jgi:nucleotide-binding universal stress UspA family protein
VVKGVIGKTIADIANKEKVNLILMTMHDRDALGRCPEKNGSGTRPPRLFKEEGELGKRMDEVAEEIIKYAECPVLLVPV